MAREPHQDRLRSFWPRSSWRFNAYPILGAAAILIVVLVLHLHTPPGAITTYIYVLPIFGIPMLVVIGVRAPMVHVFPDRMEVRHFFRTVRFERGDVMGFVAEPASRGILGPSETKSNVEVIVNVPDTEVGKSERVLRLFWSAPWIGTLENREAADMINWLQGWRTTGRGPDTDAPAASRI
jgi:hypothetical protein